MKQLHGIVLLTICLLADTNPTQASWFNGSNTETLATASEFINANKEIGSCLVGIISMGCVAAFVQARAAIRKMRAKDALFGALKGDSEDARKRLDEFITRGASLGAIASIDITAIAPAWLNRLTWPWLTALKFTPLHGAICWGSENWVRALIKRGADIDAKGIGGFTPLHHASSIHYASPNIDRFDVAQLLLTYGANIDAKTTNDDWTPLHIAASYNNMPTALLLLVYGAKIDAKDVKGWTPLYLAAIHNNMNTVQLLLAYGADPFIETNQGTTAMEFLASQQPVEPESELGQMLRKRQDLHNTFQQPWPVSDNGREVPTYEAYSAAAIGLRRTFPLNIVRNVFSNFREDHNPNSGIEFLERVSAHKSEVAQSVWDQMQNSNPQ